MPNSEAQARLIRDTYARCGLSPECEVDRPQYFKGYGTGTPAETVSDQLPVLFVNKA